MVKLPILSSSEIAGQKFDTVHEKWPSLRSPPKSTGDVKELEHRQIISMVTKAALIPHSLTISL